MRGRVANAQVWDAGLAVIVTAIGAFTWIESTGLPERAAYVPMLIGIVLTVTGAMMLTGTVITIVRRLEARPPPFAEWRKGLWALYVVALLGFYFGLDVLGFYETAFVFIFAMVTITSRYQRTTVQALRDGLVYALGAAVGIYIIFDIVLNLPTGSGLLV